MKKDNILAEYEKVVAYIFDIPRFTSKNTLDNTKAFVKMLDCDLNELKIIHVAGTNGKGSVCAYLANVLTATGRKTGLFTSPHLVKVNERFQINNEAVTDEEFLEAFKVVETAIAKLVKEGYFHPTFFETVFGIALILFKWHQVEYVILETGLGGRLDTTNIVESPIATIITSIGYDHISVLGNTLTEIAGEKAGIIKKNVPIIYDGRNQEVAQVIQSRAKDMQAPAYAFQEDMCEILANTHKNIDFLLDTQYDEKTKVSLYGNADYQIVNSSLAIMALEVLNKSHFPKQAKGTIKKEEMLSAIFRTRWAGRMEEVLPNVIIDGAHNVQGIKAFNKVVNKLSLDKRCILLFTAVKEKDYEKIIESICKETNFDTIIVTSLNSQRAVNAQELTDVFRKYTETKLITQPVIEEAFETAKDEKGIDGILFCGGSLYLVGAIKEIIRRNSHD